MNSSTLIKSKIINIGSFNSNKRNASFNSSVSITLPQFFTKGDTTIKNIYFSVIHSEIPNSFYLINYSNNTLIINGTTYTIPNGNYNATSLMTVLKSLLTGFTITYNSITLKYTFTNSTAFIISKYSTILKVIGGDTSNDSPSSLTYTMPYVVNFLPIPRLNFRTNSFNFDNFNSSDSSADMFLSVQNNGLLGSMILYNNITSLKNIVNMDHFNNVLNIQITDDYGNLIDFNNAHWFLTFQIDIEFIRYSNNLTFSDFVK